MAKLQSIGFDPRLLKRIKDFAKKENLSFAEAVRTLSRYGLDLAENRTTGNPIILQARVEELQKMLNVLDGEREHLWGLVESQRGTKDVYHGRFKELIDDMMNEAYLFEDVTTDKDPQKRLVLIRRFNESVKKTISELKGLSEETEDKIRLIKNEDKK